MGRRSSRPESGCKFGRCFWGVCCFLVYIRDLWMWARSKEDPMFNLPYQRNHCTVQSMLFGIRSWWAGPSCFGTDTNSQNNTTAINSIKRSSQETFRSHADYFIHGINIFRSTFQFIYCLSDKHFRNLTQHYDMNGLVIRVHGNSKRLPHDVLTLENTEKVTAFIKKLCIRPWPSPSWLCTWAAQ